MYCIPPVFFKKILGKSSIKWDFSVLPFISKLPLLTIFCNILKGDWHVSHWKYRQYLFQIQLKYIFEKCFWYIFCQTHFCCWCSPGPICKLTFARGSWFGCRCIDYIIVSYIKSSPKWERRSPVSAKYFKISVESKTQVFYFIHTPWFIDSHISNL